MVLRIHLESGLIHTAIQMNREFRHAAKRTHPHKLLFKLVPILYHGNACNSQIPIEPGIDQSAAVNFRMNQMKSRYIFIGIRRNFQGGKIRMRRRQSKTRFRRPLTRRAERKNRRTAPHKISTVQSKLPRLGFQKFYKSLQLQLLCQICRRVPRRYRIVQIIQQIHESSFLADFSLKLKLLLCL